VSFQPLVRIWIWVSVLATVAGWSLSAIGQLNRAGYTVFFAATAAILFVLRLRRPLFKAPDWPVVLKPLRRRFKRFLPACFAVLAFLIFLGGAIYAPSNHTSLTYRTPRVLHWLAEGHWHWIHTPDYRMNNRACGIEWLSAPLFLFTKSDRALFLLNFIPFLLLPGLLFSLFTRLGVRRRVAWQWMWLLPTGYSFLLQAGSAGNDTFPTVYALAAMDFGCRAWNSRRPSDLWMSILSAALLTGAKASNLPLLLPWAILMLALGPRFKSSWSASTIIATAVVVVIAAVVSFLPTAVLNVVYCGDWSGLNLERTGMDMKNPFVGIWGNAFLLLLNNFVPPFFPQAGWWNQSALTLLPHVMTAPMVANFEPGFLTLGEIPTEDWVGLGFGVSLLMVTAGLFHIFSSARRERRTHQSFSRPAGREVQMLSSTLLRRLLLVAPWLALLAYCMKSGMVTGARLISPYYPLLLPLLITGASQSRLIRTRLWRILVWLVMLLAFPVLVLTPGRPLWPARTILSKALAAKPGSRALSRALTVYKVYANRPDPLAEVRALLPKGVTRVGFMGTEDDIDISFWRPFGQRRVEHILLSDTPAQIREHGFNFVVVGGFYLASNNTTIESWLEKVQAEVIGKATATLKVSEGPQQWYVVRLRDRI
jgi:hypothetical protein